MSDETDISQTALLIVIYPWFFKGDLKAEERRPSANNIFS
jgi:hypothetical protein